MDIVYSPRRSGMIHLAHVCYNKPHRFIEFSDDFATWVLFYGPEGGE